MRALLIAVLVLVPVSGCDDPCADGVCPDLAYSTLRVGPCESGYASDGYEQRCSYSYTDGRLSSVSCDWQETGAEGEHGIDTTTWLYDADGLPTKVEYTHDNNSDGIGSYSRAWIWNGGVVESWSGDWSGRPHHNDYLDYQSLGFAFLPLVGSDVISPDVDFAVASLVGHSYTESRTGSVVTRTRDDGKTILYKFDDAGHIIERSTGDGLTRMRWTYSGERIIHRENHDSGVSSSWRYEYDAGGNVAAARDDDGNAHEAYSYDCW